MRLVRANHLQRQKLKQLHWDAVRNADGMVWGDLASSTELDVDELERLFKLLDNKALKYALCNRLTVFLLSPKPFSFLASSLAHPPLGGGKLAREHLLDAHRGVKTSTG